MTQPTIYSNNIGRHVPLRDLPWSELEEMHLRWKHFLSGEDPIVDAVRAEHSRRRAE